MALASYERSSGSIGSVIAIDDLAALAADPTERERLREELDERLVVQIVPAAPVDARAIEAIARELGRPEPVTASDRVTVPGFPFLMCFAARARPDSGRPHVPTAIEQLHCDILDDGPASHGLLHTRHVPPGVIQRFVDMRAVYASLPAATRARLDGATCTQYPRPTPERPRPPGRTVPLVVAQPRTGRAALLLPIHRSARIDGMPEEEGRALVRELWAIAESAPARLEVVDQSNDLLIWDNIAAAHDNPAYPRDRDRTSWFLNTAAAEPLAAHRL